jgi:hypothetical protein
MTASTYKGRWLFTLVQRVLPMSHTINKSAAKYLEGRANRE